MRDTPQARDGNREPTEAERTALTQMFAAWQSLKALGWKNIIYCPKDGTHFDSIEPGSTGIHDTNYEGTWPDGSWWIYDGDIWPARPCLWKAKLVPEAPDGR